MSFKPIEELTFTDNFMFCHAMKNEELCKELLEKLLHIKIDHIVYPELEKELTAYYESKSIRLDVYVKNSDKIYDIEMQNQQSNFLPLRTGADECFILYRPFIYLRHQFCRNYKTGSTGTIPYRYNGN